MQYKSQGEMHVECPKNVLFIVQIHIISLCTLTVLNVTDDCYHRGWSIVEATHLTTDRQYWRTYIWLLQHAPASP